MQAVAWDATARFTAPSIVSLFTGVSVTVFAPVFFTQSFPALPKFA
jgi:hypothetical protein